MCGESTYVYVAGHDGDVLEVEGRVDLVHEVERRGLEVVQGEHQRQRAERLLSSRQVVDLLPALLRRTHTRRTQDNSRAVKTSLSGGPTGTREDTQ